jgi:hypothetical protein
MSTRIFISYRRQDSIATAGRLHDRMIREFSRGDIFMDVDSIPAGVDFVEHLDEQVARCDVLLAIIGPNWLAGARESSGVQQTGSRKDFVLVEIVSALNRDIRVIPVLVDGAALPKAEDLPESLRPLVRRNAVEVRNTQFHADAARLIEKIREGKRTNLKYASARRLAAIFGVSFLIIAAVTWIYRFALPLKLPSSDSRQIPSGFSASDFRLEGEGPPPVCEPGISALPEAVPVNSKGLANLSLLKQARAFASSIIPGFPHRHQTNYLIDGWYNNCRSWIPAVMPAWIEVDLGGLFELSSIKFGSEHTKFWGDRAPTAFSISVRADQSSEWIVVYNQDAGQGAIQETTEFQLSLKRAAQYLRIDITATRDGDLPRLDEVEIYGRKY